MATTIKEERLRWVLPITRGDVRLVDTAKVCPYGRRSLERWVQAYRSGGEKALEPRSTEPKKYRIETKIRLKERIISIRKKTKKCSLKIHWQLEKEGVQIHARTNDWKDFEKGGISTKISSKENQIQIFESRKATRRTAGN